MRSLKLELDLVLALDLNLPNIQTDHYIEHRRPDILVFEKDSKRCFLIDIASPGDKRVVEKEQEKIEHYSDLKRELKKIWKCSHIEIVPTWLEL